MVTITAMPKIRVQLIELGDCIGKLMDWGCQGISNGKISDENSYALLIYQQSNTEEHFGFSPAQDIYIAGKKNLENLRDAINEFLSQENIAGTA